MVFSYFKITERSFRMKKATKTRMSLLLSLLFFVTTVFSSTVLVYAEGTPELKGRKMGPVESLGAPLEDVQTLSAVYGMEDGHNMMYTTSNGFPGVFSVIDLDTYELVRSFPLENTSRSWTHAIDKEGNVYIGGYGLGSADARLFHYSPITKEIEDLGVAIQGENVIWDITVDEEGNVYGGTYNNGKVFKYDVAAKKFTDFGQVDPAEDNVRAIAYYNGYIYAGTGPLNGRVWKIKADDPSDKQRIEIPDSPMKDGKPIYNKASMKYVYDLTIIGNRLYTFFNGDFVMMAYDMDTGEWLMDNVYQPVRGGVGLSPAFNGKAYYAERIIGAFKLMEIDLETGEASPAPVNYGLGLREMAMVTLPNQPDFPDPVIITNNYSGGVILMDMDKGKITTLPSLAKPGETSIQSFEKGNDGKIYISGYMGSSGIQFDPKTKEFTKFPLEQVEGMTPLGDKMYMGVYPGARIMELDTTKPMGSSNRPKELFSMSGEKQDRPFAMTSGDGKLFIGTIADYGQLGGALAIYDPATGEKSVHRNVVQNQSVVGLAYKDGKIYGSTTISGGLGITPTEPAAKVFVWDVEKGEKILETVPNYSDTDKTPKAISGLTFDKDGLLWGVAQNTLFAMDPTTLEVVKKLSTGPNNWGAGHYWRPVYMKWGKDGLLYTTLGGKLTVIDTETLEYRQLADTNLMTLDDEGNIYYAQSARFYKVPVTGEIIPGEPTEPVIPGIEDKILNPSFEQPVVDGVIPGWEDAFPTQYPKENTSFEVTDEKSFTGKYSLKVVDASTAGPVKVTSNKVKVTPGVEYYGKANVFLESGRTYLSMNFYDKDGNDLSVKPSIYVEIRGEEGKWREVETRHEIAPPNAVYATVSAFCTIGWTTSIYYDDITLESVRPVGNPGTLEITAPRNAPRNNEFEVTLTAKETNDLYSLLAKLTYDPTKIEVIDVTPTTAFGTQSYLGYKDDNGNLLITATQTGDSVINKDTEVAVIRFKTLSELGDTTITLRQDSELAQRNADETKEIYHLEKDIIQNITILMDIEDVNKDGKVDIIDVVTVAKNIGKALTDTNKACDVNGDGTIDISDLALVAVKMMDLAK